jgi:DNA-binding HxlR family transcriptional regulator
MLGRTYEAQNCSAARALELVGERWSILIIRDALYRGISRFSDFQRSLGVAANILASRLDGFVDAGLMTRRRYCDRPDQYEYVLTDKGRSMQPVIVALTEWGDRWAAPYGPPVLFRHAACDDAVTQQLRCAVCGELPTSAEVQARPGPGSRSVPHW